ncbi:MAG: hypothetical protein IH948_00020 [Bacteroidetes bacterium]|nr:hypothetical protein [Bacteroidota bacterium]
MFLIEWLFFYVGIVFAMSIDNYFWIPSDKEWFLHKRLQPHFYSITIKGKAFIFPKDKWAWNFVLKKRVWEVVKDPYDIIPAIITSFILSLVL